MAKYLPQACLKRICISTQNYFCYFLLLFFYNFKKNNYL
ncbi:hypothetical protein BFO_0477 [Tannerella forsythia 92A2]|uniref:Uncharacterized protein n=1 Tax=Tannerella forsythia (strain ATCC 43037 / JCM 10827 / CCUG 21028 A / KCTC 5666 / FDC 338) TaxID=203275 RepID=G8UKY6_TANFA|nr:hypothetical protein BFO_0477 [Tannerella forsythia 92A2]